MKIPLSSIPDDVEDDLSDVIEDENQTDFTPHNRSLLRVKSRRVRNKVSDIRDFKHERGSGL